jgi:hypothetical protein
MIWASISPCFDIHYATTSAPGQKLVIMRVSNWPGASYRNELDVQYFIFADRRQ